MELMIWIFREILNAPKSHTMQEMQAKVLIRYNA